MRFFRKAISAVLAGVLCISAAVPAFAAGNGRNNVYDRAVAKYPFGEQEFVKISHPEKPASAHGAGSADGILDYLGEARLGVPGVDAGAEGQGDRGMTYSWGSVAYGDWMYVCTQYSSMMSTLDFTDISGQSGGMQLQEIKDQIRDLFENDLFIEEEDGGAPGSALVKINVKTGEVKKILSKDSTGKKSYNFRNAVEFKGKLYFCGSVQGTPSIYEIDPENNDRVQCVYEDQFSWSEALKKGLSPTIRGMTVFGDYLVISSVGIDANPYIAVSSDPSKGKSSFHKIAENYIGDEEGELFGYAACHNTDSIMGGSIWEMVSFQDKLYVALCTGTPENSPDGGKTMQSFAIVRGECSGPVEERSSWTWTPVVGDPEDNARYPFGIDPERTRAAACNMKVYKDHLYIGEYNDTEIALFNILFDMDFEFMADNLQQSVNLYRMDADENMELVAGRPSEMFPKGERLTSLGAGFGTKGHTRHENQYVWQMNVYQDQLFIGTFDESTLLYPLAKFTNGDLLGVGPEEWIRQLRIILEFLGQIFGDHHEAVLLGSEPLDAETEEKIAAAALTADEDDPVLREILEAQQEADAFLNAVPDLTILDLPAAMGEQNTISSLKEFHTMMVLMPKLMEQNPEWTLDEQIAAKQQLIKLYDSMYTYLEDYLAQPNSELTNFIREIYELLMRPEVRHRLIQLGRCLVYLSTSDSGFDMFAFDGTSLKSITRDGMGDPFNHGLRAFAISQDEENPWMCIGTANPCYGTQVWRLYDKQDQDENEDEDEEEEETDLFPGLNPLLPLFAMNPRTIVLTIGDHTVVVDGTAFENDVAPVIRNDRTFIPARVVAENLGAIVTWDAENRTVTIWGENSTTIVLTIGSKKALVNNEVVTMDVAPFIEGNRTYTPARFIAENLGAAVTWDAEDRIVTIVK